MKDFIFVSDFDGTMTERDFYLIVMDNYRRDWQTLNAQWHKDQLTTFEFLAAVFAEIGAEEEQIIKDILTIQFDPNVLPFVNKVKEAGGDFAVLSAGADYYIKRVLDHHGVKDVMLLANKGVYENKGIKMTTDKESPFYSKFYGIDKGAVIRALKKEYKKVYFAGDSSPDVPAALEADLAFARNELARLLKEEHKKPFASFVSFMDIDKYLLF